MPYSNSLTFSDTSEITFHPTANSILIKVNDAELGSITKNYPVTIFVELSGNTKKIWMKEISESLYHLNNNNDPQRTVIFNQNDPKADLAVSKCTTSNVFKISGWENEDNPAITCAGGNGYNAYFFICNENNFRAKIESVPSGLTMSDKMVVRYGQNIINACSLDASCCTNLFCYECL